MLTRLKRNGIFRLFIFMISGLIIRMIRFFNPPQKLARDTVLFINLHNLGDSCFTLPALVELSKYYAGYRKVIIAYSSAVPIYRLVSADLQHCEFVDIERGDFRFGRFAVKQIRNKIRAFRPHTIIDLSGGIHSLSAFITSGAQEVIGINLPEYRSAFTRFIPIRRTPHLMDMYLDICRALSITPDENKKEHHPDYCPTDPISIFPFAGWNAKEYPFKKFVEIACNLKQIYKIAFIAQKDQLSKPQMTMLKENNIDLTECNSTDELINALRETSLLISNDTGPIYIAALLGKPTFTVYGPTNPEYSIPFGEHHIYIKKTMECSPLSTQYCETDAGRNCPHFNCMQLLEADEVLTKVQKHLEKLGIRESH